MPTYLLEEVANLLNDRFVAAGRDRIFPVEGNTVLAVSDKIDSLQGPGGMFPGIPGKPF